MRAERTAGGKWRGRRESTQMREPAARHLPRSPRFELGSRRGLFARAACSRCPRPLRGSIPGRPKLIEPPSCDEGSISLEGPTGIEPAFLAWEANVLPLDDGPGRGMSGVKPDRMSVPELSGFAELFGRDYAARLRSGCTLNGWLSRRLPRSQGVSGRQLFR